MLQSGVIGGHWGDPAIAHCHHIIGVRAGRVVRGHAILERRVWVYSLRGNGIAWSQGRRRRRVCAVTVGVEGGRRCWVVEEGVLGVVAVVHGVEGRNMGVGVVLHEFKKFMSVKDCRSKLRFCSDARAGQCRRWIFLGNKIWQRFHLAGPAKSPQKNISKTYESNIYSSKQTPRAYRVAEILRKYLPIAINSVLGSFRSIETGVFLFALQEGPYFFYLLKSYLAELYFCFRTPNFGRKSILFKFSFPGSKPDSIVARHPQFHNKSPHY